MVQKHILIVDDDVIIRKALSDFLTLKGYIPIAADSGEAALALLLQYAPSVVLLDLCLGDISGLSVMKKIKAYDPHAECIVLTGYASQDSAIEAINGGEPLCRRHNQSF